MDCDPKASKDGVKGVWSCLPAASLVFRSAASPRDGATRSAIDRVPGFCSLAESLPVGNRRINGFTTPVVEPPATELSRRRVYQESASAVSARKPRPGCNCQKALTRVYWRFSCVACGVDHPPPTEGAMKHRDLRRRSTLSQGTKAVAQNLRHPSWKARSQSPVRLAPSTSPPHRPQAQPPRVRRSTPRTDPSTRIGRVIIAQLGVMTADTV